MTACATIWICVQCVIDALLIFLGLCEVLGELSKPIIIFPTMCSILTLTFHIAFAQAAMTTITCLPFMWGFKRSAVVSKRLSEGVASIWFLNAVIQGLANMTLMYTNVPIPEDHWLFTHHSLAMIIWSICNIVNNAIMIYARPNNKSLQGPAIFTAVAIVVFGILRPYEMPCISIFGTVVHLNSLIEWSSALATLVFNMRVAHEVGVLATEKSADTVHG